MNYQRIICYLSFFFACSSTLITTSRAEMEVVQDAYGNEGLTVFRLKVTPAAEPVPALKHRFSVPLHEQLPGNAATHYLRSFGEGGSPGRLWRRLRDIHGEEIDNWYDLDFPVEKIPMDQFREVARSWVGYVNNHIRSASVRRECEWGLEEMDLRGMETISYLLPDAQESRGISRALALLSRLATIDKNYDDAIEYIRMNYQLGQDFAKQRFLVCSLIGIAEAGMANHSAIELIAAPNSPNLYWALTELPRPLIDMREAIDLEMSLGLRIFPALLDVEEVEHSPEEWTRLITGTLNDLGEANDLISNFNSTKRETGSRLMATAIGYVAYPAAKQRLIDSGMSAEKVEAMPVAQVLMLDTAREYKRFADELEKWWYVDYSELPRTREEELGSGDKFAGGFGKIITDLLLPAIDASRKAQMRVEWQMNAIRAIEALRMHVAETGKLPATLGEVEVVPVPKNPLTQQPYHYRLENETAVLELPFSDGMPGIAWRFEIQLAN